MKQTTEQRSSNEGTVPLNKFIAHAGICSRRKAVDLIAAGHVTVNGQVVKEPGFKVGKKDAVKVNNKLIAQVTDYVYLVLNKPRGYVTTLSDEQGRHAVIELIKLPKKQRVYPVGRLDINSTGVLLLTNDGDLAQKLAHPAHRVSKVYDVTLHKEVSEEALQQLTTGVRLADGVIVLDDLFILPDPKKNKIRVTLHSGKNRIVRRIFEQLGYIVEKLDRVSFGGVSKRGLASGAWRMLSSVEVHRLKKL